ncbi:hypothetical protein LMH87_007345 [Akanthomyces muscarius]|uniref:Uncharacterized protein n=1 Tax=Akanthomyces muscarius TaxID=2231603 RepID=A0A9W8QRF5_AKAMU|nr:hypothetical protein LMH87_007345 [Akanthomyces muscarius]KAJ4165725.1 hypothetical protein LMH87_007345 [Akanthomyces muscarius]
MSAPQERAESLTTSVRHHAVDAYTYAQRSLDRVIDPATQRKAYDASHALASTRPFFFSAAATLLFFSALPILLFATFALSVAAMAVGGSILFALFWLALGVLVLVPTLGVTTCLALLVWAWAAGSFVVGRAAYRAAVSWGDDASRHQRATDTKGQQFKQPPPVPQVRPEKKTANGNGHEVTATG